MFLLLKPKIFRHIIQMSISLFLLYVGWKFYKFTLYVQSGGKLPYIDKPEAVEGFLPISALLGFKQWLLTGVYDPIHPAGLTIFLAVLITALIFKKGFCSWLCPIGTISEGLALAGEKMFGKNFTLPRWLDLLLMSLKYLILAFFMKVIFLDMSIFSIQAFLNSPYNMVADIKMLYFFLDISRTTYYVLLTLAFFSLFIKQFWCRYLCPYGALQGLISILSFFKIRRKENQCINCGLCNKNCPGMISVSEKQTISSPEDTVILTLACGKYRFNKKEFGTIGELPRLLDIGQCNDAYAAIKIAVALAEAFECDVNDLPLSLILSWYEQKAVCILLTLLSLNIKNIYLGPSLPAFVSPNVLQVLVDNFNIKPISNVEADMEAILG